MTATDIWATSAAFMASLALGLRANMLKPALASWKTAPDWVWLAVSACSAMFGAVGINIIGSGGAGAREAGAYTGIAGLAVIMLVNLVINGKSDPDAVHGDQVHHV